MGEHFRRWAAISAICVGALFLALLALGIGLNRWAQSEGFVDYSEKSRANRAGVFDGGQWHGAVSRMQWEIDLILWKRRTDLDLGRRGEIDRIVAAGRVDEFLRSEAARRLSASIVQAEKERWAIVDSLEGQYLRRYEAAQRQRQLASEKAAAEQARAAELAKANADKAALLTRLNDRSGNANDSLCAALFLRLWERGVVRTPSIDVYPADNFTIGDVEWAGVDFETKSCIAQGASRLIAIKRGNACGNGHEPCGHNDVDVLSAQTRHVLGRWHYFKLTVE